MMHTNLGWPQTPGVPLNSAHTGAHVLTHVDDHSPIQGPWFLLWCAPERMWTDVFGNRRDVSHMAEFRYVGACVTPSTHAQAVQQGIQQAADWLIAEVELDHRANGRFADHQRGALMCELAQQIRALAPQC